MRWLDSITDSMDMSLSKTPGDSGGQKSLACCSPWGCQDSNITQGLNNNNNGQHSPQYQRIFQPRRAVLPRMGNNSLCLAFLSLISRPFLEDGLCVCAQLLSCVQLFVIPWTIDDQVSLSMGFSRQEYWSGLPFPPPEDLPHLGIEHAAPVQTDSFFTTESPGKPYPRPFFSVLIPHYSATPSLSHPSPLSTPHSSHPNSVSPVNSSTTARATKSGYVARQSGMY